MAELLVNLAQERGSEPALIDENGVTSWASFDERVNRVIHGLRALGVVPGTASGGRLF